MVSGSPTKDGQNGSPEGLQVAPEFANPAMERRRMKGHHPRKEVREKASDLAQESAFGLHPSQLLEEDECEDLGVRKLLEGGVESHPIWD
jgi:hypothetical protein